MLNKKIFHRLWATPNGQVCIWGARRHDHLIRARAAPKNARRKLRHRTLVRIWTRTYLKLMFLRGDLDLPLAAPKSVGQIKFRIKFCRTEIPVMIGRAS